MNKAVDCSISQSFSIDLFHEFDYKSSFHFTHKIGSVQFFSQ